MNNAKFLHASMAGSFYEKCEIVEWNVPYSKEYWSFTETAFNRPTKYNQDDLGAVVKYYDSIAGKHKTIWVEKDLVKLPKISEWIGM